jgi:membrane protease YdiL (CAAX protease family)
MLTEAAYFGLALLGWGLFWALLCLGLCAGRLASAPRLVGRAALACALHQVVLVLPSWSLWASWLGLALSPAAVNPVYHPVAWGGKAMGLLLTGLLLYGLKWVTPAETGLRQLQQGSGRVVAPLVFVVAAALFVDAYLSRHAFTQLWWRQQLYVATMPGLEEELFYRGALLGLLGRVFPRTVPLPGARTTWGGLAGVILFTLGHHIKFMAGFQWLNDAARLLLHGYGWVLIKYFFFSSDILFQLGLGTLFLWVRERTGSVWAAVAAHCLMNSVLALGHAIS